MSMLTVDEALRAILDRVAPLDPERLPLLDAVGRVLAEAVVADRALPAWDNSAMDGYAVRAVDVPVPGCTLPVVDLIPAGDAADRPLPAGCAARIFTGAPLPPGADTVVMQEDARREGDRVTFTEAPAPGAHVRRRGGDVQPGAVVLPAGRALQPGDLGLLTALGRSHAAVVRAPVVAIAGTGDELVEVDAGPPGPGRVVNSNTVMLAAAVRAAGAVPRVLPVIPDTAEATRAALQGAARADVLLTCGGVSVGDYDHVGNTLRALAGAGFAFWKVAVKPGKPLAFGHIGHCAVFGLPGNPVSAQVTFELFVRPAIRRLMGHRAVRRAPVPAVLDAPIGPGGTREEYLRAAVRRLGGVLRVDPARSQSSGALSSLAGADALVIIRPGAPARAVGETVETLLLGAETGLE